MITMIDVQPGNMVDAVRLAVKTWAPPAEGLPLRLAPSRLDPNSYLIIAGEDKIVARLHVLDEAGDH